MLQHIEIYVIKWHAKNQNVLESQGGERKLHSINASHGFGFLKRHLAAA